MYKQVHEKQDARPRNQKKRKPQTNCMNESVSKTRPETQEPKDHETTDELYRRARKQDATTKAASATIRGEGGVGPSKQKPER